MTNKVPRPPPLLGIFLIGLALALATQPLTGGDQYWHLAVGRYLWDHGAIPWNDPFSWTMAGKPWTPHALGFDFLLEATHRVGGLLGVRFFRGLLPALFGLSLFSLLRTRLPGQYRTAAYLTIATVACSLDLAIPRPYWVPLIMIPLLWRWVDRALEAPEGELPALGWYFLGSWLWAMSHGSVILAVVLPGTALVFDGFWRGRARPLLGAIVCALVATLSTPHGFGLWRYVAQIPNNQYHVESGFVTEWLPPGLFGETVEVNLLLLVFLGLAIAKGRLKQVPRWELVWAAVWIWGYTKYLRQLGLAVMAASVLVAEVLGEAPKFPEQKAPSAPPDLRTVLLGALLLFGGSSLAPRDFAGPHVDQGIIPTEALDPFLAETKCKRLFHRFHWGGYVSWRSDHRVKAFFDGRTFVFGEAINRDYRTLLLAKEGWEEVFDRHDFDGVLLIRTAPLLKALEARGGWREAPFAHPDVRLLVPESPAP